MNVREHPTSQASRRPVAARCSATDLPTWPLGLMFGALPLWWVTGVLDVVTIPFALLMAWLMARASGVRVPRGFGWWLLYCAWSAASVVMLDRAAGIVLFGYRWLLCVAAGVIFAYVFNARATLTSRYLSGTLTLWFLYVTLGGCLGLLVPTGSLRTPVNHLLPAAARANELIGQMTIRPFAQYNPHGFLEVSPRPTAPFLYTNNWGSVYSLLAPFVVVHLLHTWRTRRGAAVALLLVGSTIPAFLTLNRGMFVSLGIAIAYLVGRAVLARSLRIVAVVALAATLGVVLFNVLPISERLGMRLNEDAQGTSNTTRISLYEQSLSAVASSPLLGHATPIPPANPLEPSVGTQGQLWMLLVSHGPVAAIAWISFFLVMYVRGRRRGDPIGVAACTTLLVGTVQLLFYGMLPYGLPLLMIAAAVAARGPELPATTQGDPR
jgi:O-antigen ligase